MRRVEQTHPEDLHSQEETPRDSLATVRYNVLLVSDFFYPHQGGVESHIYNLAQMLIARGHKVVVVTRAYHTDPESGSDGAAASTPHGRRPKQWLNRNGVRYMMNGLKVYYLPFFTMGTRYGRTTILSAVGFSAYYRDILLRESIDIVHGHQGSSMMALEFMILGVQKGLPTLLTEHSLFGFGSPAQMWLNKSNKSVVGECNRVICCSHVSRENLCLRLNYPPEKVYVVPHAVDTAVFRPFRDRTAYVRKDGRVTIVIVTRLTVRKGAAILVKLIPRVLKTFPGAVKFLIAGGGEMEQDFRTLLEKNQYSPDEVELLGRVDNSLVPQVLNRGDIFLNASLTEVFCIAILEAAACGLYVVATRVGGVPEILPDDMISLCSPDTAGMMKGVAEALKEYGKVDRFAYHRRVHQMYSWAKTAQKTERVYDDIMKTHKPRSWSARFSDFFQTGPIIQWLSIFMAILIAIVWWVLGWIRPEEEIDLAFDLPEICRQRAARRARRQQERVASTGSGEGRIQIPTI